MVIGKGSCRDIIFSSYFFAKNKTTKQANKPANIRPDSPDNQTQSSLTFVGVFFIPEWKKGEWRNICIWQSGQPGATDGNGYGKPGRLLKGAGRNDSSFVRPVG